MLTQVTVSAPGKLMLMGEHAVVYDFPCLVTAVDSRFYLTAKVLIEPKFILHAPDLGIIDYQKPLSQIGLGDIPDQAKCTELAIKNFIKKYSFSSGIKIETKSSFSQKYGFGSSSASIVCTVKALGELKQLKLSNQELFDLSYQTVLEKQGVGSGFDVAASIWGGTLYFVTAGKKIEPIKIDSIPLCIGYTGVKSNTTQIVKEIAKKKQEFPDNINKIFESISQLVESGKKALMEKDWVSFGKFMNFNQNYLEDLGVNSEKLADMISHSQKAGSLGAKLSGAGGGDCMIALYNTQNKSQIEEAIVQAGGEAVNIKTNVEGVRIETTDNQKEMFVVVDKDDKILEYRSRYDCHHDKTLRHRSSGTAIFNDQGEILMIKRSSTKDLGAGTWDATSAGHVQKNETYEAAAKRELFEELGIKGNLKLHSKYLFDDYNESEIQALYTVIYNGPFNINPEEIETVEFVSKSKLPRKILNKEIIFSPWAERNLQELGYLT